MNTQVRTSVRTIECMQFSCCRHFFAPIRNLQQMRCLNSSVWHFRTYVLVLFRARILAKYWTLLWYGFLYKSGWKVDVSVRNLQLFTSLSFPPSSIGDSFVCIYIDSSAHSLIMRANAYTRARARARTHIHTYLLDSLFLVLLERISYRCTF